MSFEDDDFLKELQEGFLFESKDLLAQVEALSLQIEKKQDEEAAFQELARLAHNLKGSGKAVGFDEISKLAHKVEDYILALKNKKLDTNSGNLDFLFHCLDILKNDVDLTIADRSTVHDYQQVIAEIEAMLSGGGPVPELDRPIEVPTQPTPVKSAAPAQHKTSNESIRIPREKLDDLLDSFGEQVILQSTLEQLKNDLNKNPEMVVKIITQLSKHTLEMHKQILSLTMIQLNPLYMKLERAIRDAAKLCNKSIEVQFFGAETEADKSLIESLSDALTHMVRNAVDHGIEESDERIKLGKPAAGKIVIEAKRAGSQIWVDINDDGKGMNPENIKRKAIEKNIISADAAEKLPDQEIFKLIFANGFSTKDTASEVSGRGVGMNVVEEVVNSLNGTIHIESKIGQGTSFRLKLPLTLAIFNGAVIRVSQTRYVIPTSEISEIVRMNVEEQVLTGENQFSLRVRDEIFEVYDLRTMIGEKKVKETKTGLMPILLTKKGKRKAFIVDEVIGVQKIVQKPIGEELKSRPGFAAATVLSDGTPGIVLSIHHIQKAS